MLDTLKLSLSEYSVSSDAQLQVQPGLVDNATGELIGNNKLWRADGRAVCGSKAWHNGQDVNVTIKPNTHTTNGPSLCLVQFSVPKVALGSNYYPVSSYGAVRALRVVEKYLADIGISTNLKSAAVSRLDAFKVAVCSEPYDSYHPVFATLQGQRMRRRDYGRTFLWENTLQEICAYDKLEEMRRNKHSVEGLPPNSLRFELRALKMQKVRNWLGIQNAGELLANLDHLEHEYRAVMEKQLFKGEVTQASKLTQGQVREQLEAAKEHCGREWFEKYLLAVAYNALGGDVDAVKAALLEVAGTRQAARKMTKKLEAAHLDAVATSIQGSSRRPLGELYTELREKVLA
jgi:hypothetical protein